MTFGRRFGIDFGASRIGIAICDPDGLVCTPLITLQNDANFFAEFAKLQDEYEAVGIFLGKPKQLSGKSGTIQEDIDSFASHLSSNSGLKITWVDERLTSSAATSTLRERGISAKASKGLIDQLAATSILELGIALEKNA